MHAFDEAEARLVLEYVRERLELAEAPLDFPGQRHELEQLISGLITEHGTDPKEYWDTLVDTELGQYLGLDYNESVELYSIKDFPPRSEF